MKSSHKRPVTRELLDHAIVIAREAGKHIMEVYETNFSVHRKEDQSPLTKADLIAHQTIIDGLSKLCPGVPVLSEESPPIPFAKRSLWTRYWLVDPLDGTREFVKRNDEFTVNLALIEQHRPVIGVVVAPVTGACYFAAKDIGAYKQEPGREARRIRARALPDGPITVAGSRSHGNSATRAFIERLGDTEVIGIGSSLKSCLIAEGRADIYPRFGPTSEWDTAAAQCVVEEAGGRVTDTSLRPLMYNTRESLTNPAFLAYGDASQDWREYIAEN